VMTFINGLTASAVVSPGEWPAGRLLTQLGLQLDLWRGWAVNVAAGERGGGALDRAGSGASADRAAPKPRGKAARARATRASAG
jgi:hypothetical protein